MTIVNIFLIWARIALAGPDMQSFSFHLTNDLGKVGELSTKVMEAWPLHLSNKKFVLFVY